VSRMPADTGASVHRMPTTTDAAVVERAAKARKAIAAANRKAARIREDQTANRSTRTRQSLLVKADALDQVGLILAGKD
jgi:hypothetical protein